MENSIKISLAQLNPTVGDFDGNCQLIKQAWQKAEDEGCALVIFTEMSTTAYPVEDLVLRESFRNAAREAIESLVDFSKGLTCDAIIGGLWEADDGKPTNSLFWISNGAIHHRQDKAALPNYGVFDEKRLFHAGEPAFLVKWRGFRVGLFVCEDMWDADIAEHIARQQPDFYISSNGSPYETDKSHRRRETAQRVLGFHPAPLIYLNQVGGQDDLVFDGSSFVMNPDGSKLIRLARFVSDQLTLKLTSDANDNVTLHPSDHYKMPPKLRDEQVLYEACMLGVRDYVRKSGFSDVLIAMSGGIDSALTAAIAVDALGADHVHCINMPSPYSSAEGIEDAAECAKLLGVDMETLNIAPAMEVMKTTLAKTFDGLAEDVTEENIQSRIRGNLAMAISNKKNYLVLTTGNKSEVAVGYCTLYGDMCGAYNPLVDIYKTTVFKMAHWRNSNKPLAAEGNTGRVIPERIITKPPSAELRPDQRDDDSLPPYDQLDEILQMLIENELSFEKIVAKGYDEETIRRVALLMYNAEYKRRQAAPGVKVSSMAFGSDYRYPIVNRFRT